MNRPNSFATGCFSTASGPIGPAQARKWLFEKRARDWEAMTDLPRALREQLAAEFCIWSSEVAVHRQDSDGTEKLLLTLADARKGPAQIECVLLRDDKGHCGMCISTQVGCAMKCAFCATGLGGLARNLTTGEIVEQMLRLQLLLKREERLSHVVCMGMGEPLANLDRLMPALAAGFRQGRTGHRRPQDHDFHGRPAAGHPPPGR